MKKKFEDLRIIMAKLRDPEHGCPWDLQQTFSSISPHTIEEAYEVIDAIERCDMAALQEELGDLLFQIVFYSQLASEKKIFDFDDIITSICDKMIRRHPHVFGNEKISNAQEQAIAWEKLKVKERENESANADKSSLAGVPNSLPSLIRAEKLQKRASQAGFDWSHVEEIFDKIYEEIIEIKVEINKNSPKKIIENEIGDLIFSCVNLARKLNISPENALRQGNKKFESRVRYIENHAEKSGKPLSFMKKETIVSLWQQAKKNDGSV